MTTNAVIKGHHVYDCFLELNNTLDANAIVVVDSNRRIVGHIPSGFCNVLAQLMRRFTGNILIYWQVKCTDTQYNLFTRMITLISIVLAVSKYELIVVI